MKELQGPLKESTSIIFTLFMSGSAESVSKSFLTSGKFHYQADAKWIEIRGLL
jgi:hypothetical protein